MCEAPKNRIVERVFISRILAYSARKNKAKGPAAYSTLKPETSSDSPSVRSKGARFVSAKVEVYHITTRGQVGKISQRLSWVTSKTRSENPPVRTTKLSRMRPKQTSYEIAWATARRAPIRAYFELEAHPEPKIVYTVRLDMAIINKMLRLRSVSEWGIGMGAQRIRASARASVGARRKRAWEEVEGRTGSLMKSFTPSATG